MGKPLWSFTIGDHSFYVSHPFTRSHHLPVGRGTRCFVAVETKTDRICLLKDTWRVVGHQPEGQVYARLKEQQVQNIPNVIVAKDVGGPNHHCVVLTTTPFSRANSRSKRLETTSTIGWYSTLFTRQTSDKDVEDYSKLVQKLMLEWLQGEIDLSDKLYLLRG
jgi:hypothetical protein